MFPAVDQQETKLRLDESGYWLPVICLICTVLPLFSSQIVILNYMDMYLYLSIVEDMLHGKFTLFATPTRTNFYPFMLYCWFELFGYELSSLRLFYIVVLELIALQTWVLGRLLFQNQSGLIGAVLVVSSYTFGHFTYFPHIDLVLLVFINFSLIAFLLVYGSEKSKPWPWILTGGCIALAFMVKEAGIWLILFLPIFSLLKRVKFRTLAQTWCIQLLPFLAAAAVLVVLSGKGYVVRYLSRLDKLTNFFVEGSGRLITKQNSGWVEQGLDHLTPFAKIFLFSISPIFWQWQNSLPVPHLLVGFEQAVLWIALAWFLLFVPGYGTAKAFILTVLFIYMPRFLYVAIAGSKVRQVLPVFYVPYLPLGLMIYLLFQKFYGVIESCSGRQKAFIFLAACGLALVGIRYGLFFNGIDQTINSADIFYSRPNPLAGFLN